MDITKGPTDLADKLYPEDKSTALAMDHVLIETLPKLRDHFMLTETEAAELGKTHTSLLTHVIPPSDIQEVHQTLTSRLTRQVGTEVEEQARAKRENEAFEKVKAEERVRYGWRWDNVFARAVQNLAKDPKLAKLLKETGASKDPAVFRAACRQAVRQLQREGK